MVTCLLSNTKLQTNKNLTVPMRGCFWKHSCMSSPFSITILNGTFSLWAPILFCGDVPGTACYQKLNYKDTIGKAVLSAPLPYTRASNPSITTYLSSLAPRCRGSIHDSCTWHEFWPGHRHEHWTLRLFLPNDIFTWQAQPGWPSWPGTSYNCKG